MYPYDLARMVQPVKPFRHVDQVWGGYSNPAAGTVIGEVQNTALGLYDIYVTIAVPSDIYNIQFRIRDSADTTTRFLVPFIIPGPNTMIYRLENYHLEYQDRLQIYTVGAFTGTIYFSIVAICRLAYVE